METTTQRAVNQILNMQKKSFYGILKIIMTTEKTTEGTYVEGVITTTGKGLGFVSLGEDSPRENDISIEAGVLNTTL